MITIIIILAIFLVVMLNVYVPDHTTIKENKVEHKSPLDPYVSEDNVVAKAKRKYKPRKPKAKTKSLEDNSIDKNIIITTKKIKKNKV